MTDLNSFIESYIDFLREVPEIGDFAKVKKSFEKKVLPNPLKNMHIVVGSGEVRSRKSDSGEFTGEITLTVTIHTGETENPSALLRMWAAVVNATESTGLFRLTESVTGKMKRDADTNSIFITTELKFET